VTAIARVLGAVHADRRWLLLGVGLSALAVLAGVALLGLSAYLVSRALTVTNVAELALAITAVRVLAIGRASFRYLERYVTHVATFRILTELRVWFYRSIEPLAPARLIDRRGGDLVARIVGDIDALQDLYIRVLVPAGAATLVGIVVVVGLGAIDPALGVILAAGLLISGLVLPALVGRRSWSAGQRRVTVRGDLQTRLVDGLRARQELLVFGASDRHDDLVDGIGRRWDRLGVGLARTRAGQVVAETALIGLVSVVALAAGIALVRAGRLDVVLLASVPLIVVAAFEATAPLSAAAQRLASAQAAAGRLTELVDAAPAVQDPASPVMRPTRYDLEIRRLRVRYDPAGPWVLDGLDLRIPHGATVAIVGASGAGKTTLVDVLARFWDYEGGSIRVGGVELRDLTGDDARALLSIASQHPATFDASLRDNLALADPDVTDERVAEVVAAVGLDDLVATLPRGIHTVVGEDGVRLSGGERQRLAIARALLRDAPILILDEATAHLDRLAEARLMRDTAPWRVGRTTILISHRASLTETADEVVTLVRGRAAPNAPGTP
jgi:ATP-binding cassette subfamily C protein CydC